MKNVMGNFGSDVSYIVFSNMLILFCYIIASIFFVYCVKKIYCNYNKPKKGIYYILILILFLIFLFAGYKNIDNRILNYNAFLSRNGLKSSIFYHILNKNHYIVNYTENKIENNVDKNIEVTNNNKVEYKEHKWNIDFDFSMKNPINSDFLLMDGYVNSLKPALENEYTGLFKGKNLILICAEAFSKYVIDKELTPTLYRLYNNGFQFSDFYQPCWFGGTSGGEYSFLTGLVPTDSTCTTLCTVGHDMCFTICNMLKKEGYHTGAFHNGGFQFYDRDKTHNETLGFDFFLATDNGLEKITGPFCNDDIFFMNTLPLYSDKQPFCMYYLTLTGHAFYNDNKSYKTNKYINRVKARYGDKYSDQVNNYLCSQLYLEDGLKNLIENLEEKNMLDDTVICVVPDHYPYGLTNNLNGNPFTDGIDYIKELYSMDYIDSFQRDTNAWILWCSTLEKDDKKYVKRIDYPTFSLDVLPTLLNLYGLDYDSRLLVGNDVFSDYEHLVFNYNEDFLTDEIKYFNEKRESFLRNGDEAVDLDLVNDVHMKVRNKIIFSKFVLDYDYYAYLKSLRR